jgi:hypothetical protein
MTEQQRYEVVGTGPGFELRRYPAHVVAEVEIDGTFEGVGNRAFGPLVSYISGRNAGKQGIAMTAPVVQRAPDDAARDVALGSTMTEAGPGRYVVGFVMPDGSVAEEMPPPLDERVTVRAVPEELAAVTRYSGRWTASAYRSHVDDLLRALDEAGYETTGLPRYARFDPPWKPWFVRRNEVVVPVRRA